MDASYMIPQAFAQAAKSPWTCIALFAALIAFAAGFACGSARPGDVVVEQPAPSPNSESAPMGTPVAHPTQGPLNIATPEPGQEIMTIPVTVTYEYPQSGAVESQGFMVSYPGDRQINLRDGRSIALPANVRIVDVVRMGQCGKTPCPVLPAYILAMGETRVEVDSEGALYPYKPGIDMNAWQFLTESGEE